MVVFYSSEKMETMKTKLQGTMDYLKVKERGETVMAFAKERPVAATLIGVAIATSILPAVAFVSFVVTFLVIGVVTLLVIEGTAIMSALVILLLTLVGSMMASVFIGASILTGLVAGRFTWRLTTPLRTMLAVRLGMSGIAGAPDNKETTKIPEEKGQMEAAPETGFTSKDLYEEEETD